jgi:formylglycine-generating enzyme required for sulfatase activity
MNVGTNPQCVGGYPGIFDMSGNVEEWENACTPGGAPDGGPSKYVCHVRGGSYLWDGGECEPKIAAIRERYRPGSGIGIRCCSP